MIYDPTAYYYAYSTIAQTLAGSFGFLVAVILYQLEKLESSMEVGANEFLDLMQTMDERVLVTRRQIKCHDWERVLETFQTIHLIPSSLNHLSDTTKSFVDTQSSNLSFAYERIK